jgi:hypothetical protein
MESSAVDCSFDMSESCFWLLESWFIVLFWSLPLRAGERVVHRELAALHLRGALRRSLEHLLRLELLQHLDGPLEILDDLVLRELEVLERSLHLLGRHLLHRFLEPLHRLEERLILDLAQELVELLDLLDELAPERRLRELLRVLRQLFGHLVELLLGLLLPFEILLELLLLLPGQLLRAPHVAREVLRLLLEVAHILEHVLERVDGLAPLPVHVREDLGRGREPEAPRVRPRGLRPVDRVSVDRAHLVLDLVAGQESEGPERPAIADRELPRPRLLLVERLHFHRFLAHAVAEEDLPDAVIVGRAREDRRAHVVPHILHRTGREHGHRRWAVGNGAELERAEDRAASAPVRQANGEPAVVPDRNGELRPVLAPGARDLAASVEEDRRVTHRAVRSDVDRGTRAARRREVRRDGLGFLGPEARVGRIVVADAIARRARKVAHAQGEDRRLLVGDLDLVGDVFLHVAERRRVDVLARARSLGAGSGVERRVLPVVAGSREELGMAQRARDVRADRDGLAAFDLAVPGHDANLDGRDRRAGRARDALDHRARPRASEDSGDREEKEHAAARREPASASIPAPEPLDREPLRPLRRGAHGNIAEGRRGPRIVSFRSLRQLERGQELVLAIAAQSARFDRGLGQRRLRAPHAHDRREHEERRGAEERIPDRRVLRAVERRDERDR